MRSMLRAYSETDLARLVPGAYPSMFGAKLVFGENDVAWYQQPPFPKAPPPADLVAWYRWRVLARLHIMSQAEVANDYWEYSEERVDMERMIAHYLRLIEEAMSKPDDTRNCL